MTRTSRACSSSLPPRNAEIIDARLVHQVSKLKQRVVGDGMAGKDKRVRLRRTVVVRREKDKKKKLTAARGVCPQRV